MNIDAETQENLSELQSFNSQADDYDLAPSSRRIAISIHGEIFTAPVEEGDLKQAHEGPAAIEMLATRLMASGFLVSDQSGREELHAVPVDGSAPPQQITDIDALELGYNWSPDSKEIAFAGVRRQATQTCGGNEASDPSRYLALRWLQHASVVAGWKVDRLFETRHFPHD